METLFEKLICENKVKLKRPDRSVYGSQQLVAVMVTLRIPNDADSSSPI